MERNVAASAIGQGEPGGRPAGVGVVGGTGDSVVGVSAGVLPAPVFSSLHPRDKYT
jgi:hypothetical protein